MTRTSSTVWVLMRLSIHNCMIPIREIKRHIQLRYACVFNPSSNILLWYACYDLPPNDSNSYYLLISIIITFFFPAGATVQNTSNLVPGLPTHAGDKAAERFERSRSMYSRLFEFVGYNDCIFNARQTIVATMEYDHNEKNAKHQLCVPYDVV